MRKLFVFLAIAALLGGCGIGERGEYGQVLLELEFNDSSAQFSILPPGDMVVTEYVVVGTGPGSSTYSETLTGNTIIGGLLPGEWTFSVVGRNAAHVALAAGTGVVDVIIGAATTCHIDVNEYLSPDGAFSLDLSWEPDIVLDPVWTGSLKNFAAVTTPLVFATDLPTCTSTTGVDPLAVSWYTLIVRLWDAPTGMDGSEVLSTGAATAVRIAAGQETHGEMELHAVQGYGSLELVFDLHMGDPLILTPNVAFGGITFYQGGSQTFTVTSTETVTSIYYLRGTQVGVDSYAFDAGAMTPDEEYRLDVVSFNVDGSRAGSGTWLVTYHDLDPEAMDIHGTLTATNNSVGENVTIDLLDATTHAVAMSCPFTPDNTGARPWFMGLAAAGDYHIRVTMTPRPAFPAGVIHYWKASGAVCTDVATADTLTVPHALGATFNFPNWAP